MLCVVEPAVPTECGKTIKALVLCKERFQEAECQDGSVFFLNTVCLSLHLCLSYENTESVSIFITDVGRGGRLGESGTQINLD